MRRTCHTDKGN